jgi:Holliday junction DNA helicase RuvA
MIASLRGTVERISISANSHLVISVGGVGYLVFVTSSHARSLSINTECLVSTSLVVREDSMTIFGFQSAESLELFDLLRSVNGVGPKSALSILDAMSVEQISLAVQSEDDLSFKSVSGIGPKTAKLIVLSLAGKMPKAYAPDEKSSSTPGARVDIANVIEALIGLGWPERVASDAVKESAKSLGTTATADALLRATLARLGNSKSVSGSEK